MWSLQTDNWFGCFYDSRNGAHLDSSVGHKEARCRGILTLYCCKAAPAATGHTLTQLLEHSLGKPALPAAAVSHVTGSGYTLPSPHPPGPTRRHSTSLWRMMGAGNMFKVNLFIFVDS